MECNITEIEGDIMLAQTQTIVIPVSSNGTGISYLAMRFFTKFPYMKEKYESFCQRKLLDPGKLWIYYTPTRGILLFPTGTGDCDLTEEEILRKGLRKFASVYAEKYITSVSFPLSELASLPGQEVLDIIREELSDCDIPISVFTKYIPSSGKIISAMEIICSPITEEVKERIKKEICFEI